MVSTKKSSLPRLLVRGAHYCSRDCYLAENYKRFRDTAIFTLLFTVFFPSVVLSQYMGDIMPFLKYFAVFYIFFGAGFLILFFLADRGRLTRMARPKNSRIGSRGVHDEVHS
ncbi:MAG: hypothetical protein ACFFFK_02815 [Candidatus Thorarchaeota archaeon]